MSHCHTQKSTFIVYQVFSKIEIATSRPAKDVYLKSMGFVRCRCQVFVLNQDGRCDAVEQGFCKFIKLRNTNKSNQPLNHEVRTASLRH